MLVVLPLIALFLIVAAGCNTVKMAVLRPTPQSPLNLRFRPDTSGVPRLSERARLTLRTYDLEQLAEKDRLSAITAVHHRIQRHAAPDLIYTFAELTYLEGTYRESSTPKLAAELFTASALYSYLYLFDPYFTMDRNPYDPQFRDICLLYNGSLEHLLRLIGTDQNRFSLISDQDYHLETEKNDWNIRVEQKSGHWKLEEIEQFKFAFDYEIVGLDSKYRQHGIGVPLLACRKPNLYPTPVSLYYLDRLAVPATVILRPNVKSIMEGNPDAIHATLEFYDPLVSDHFTIAGRDVPLESDLTTPIAYSVSNWVYMISGTLGMFNPQKLQEKLPDCDRSLVGLYMMQPYEPNKIPVIMVHGLFSSPMTWMEMFNSLRSVPEIREKYQFWFYLYPSGQPFWVSASKLRDDLKEMRETVDPNHKDANLDQMVLIGHSMGGLVSMLQTVESGDRFWSLVSDTPFEEIKGDPEARKAIQDCMFFDPNPSVKQVITIATPFRGSKFANSTTQWLARNSVKLPTQMRNTIKGIMQGQEDAFQNSKILGMETSVDSLASDSPFLPLLLESPRGTWIEYHNIIGKIDDPVEQTFGIRMPSSDGVVRMSSARADWADSEVVVPSLHAKVHTHPKAIMEVRRILLDNLNSPDVKQALTPVILPPTNLGPPSPNVPPVLTRSPGNARALHPDCL